MTETRRVAFVRHGETDWNRQRRIQGRTDVPLNETGREQARLLGRELREGQWAAVVSSPLTRAVETASLLASAAGVELLEPAPALTERNYGRAEGLPVDEVHELWPDGEYPASESVTHMTERGRAAVRELLERSTGDLVIVSHGALLRATMSVLVGRPFPRVVNGTATVLGCSDGVWLPSVSRTMA